MLSLLIFIVYNISAIMAIDTLYALLIMFGKAYGLTFLSPMAVLFIAFLFLAPRKIIFITQSLLWPYVWATILSLAFPITTPWWIVDIIAGISWSIMLLVMMGYEIAHRF